MPLLTKFTNAFPLWTLLGGLWAMLQPEAFTWFSKPFIAYGLGAIMLGMGLTLSPHDFQPVVKRPILVLTGVFLQFTVMPFCGYMLGYIFALPTPLAIGLVVVSSCPGGVASNVITFLSKADVALSVAMTSVSTLLSVIVTPILIVLLADGRTDVDGYSQLKTIFTIVILPVLTGIILNQKFPRITSHVRPVAPAIAVLLIVLIVGSIMGAQRGAILESGLMLLGAIVCLHVIGFSLGGLLSYLVTKNERAAQTTAIEVGMQNSALGVKLADQLPSMPIHPSIPSAISAIVHCLIGSAVAFILSRRNQRMLDTNGPDR